MFQTNWIDNLDSALSFYVPVNKPPSMEEEEYQEGIRSVLVRQQAIADFVDGKISGSDFAEIIDETGCDPSQYEEDVIDFFKWNG
ncbi:hypothetical protein [Argonema galeatum]|uniref:hypothetical protein n=1 Tax=Argonema galeatum TaxID=2942762 RepID=UPI002011600A|nr:hypothetical protein [Argonema galeatum]MCL1468679.1 hypothetical protein [Argonema galeatum A003/A1]